MNKTVPRYLPEMWEIEKPCTDAGRKEHQKGMWEAEELEKQIQLHTTQMGHKIYCYQETDSTNTRAIEAARQGAVQGTLFVAEQQTQGRGRRGRKWDSPAGENLYFSLLLRPAFAPDKASMLTLLMAMAVQQTIEVYCPCGIKWPNDIVVKGRKLCGILTELGVAGHRIDYVVIGVGINVNRRQFTEELAKMAVSLETECGYPVSKEALLVDILKNFEKLYRQFLQSLDLRFCKENYNAHLVNRNERVRVLDPVGEYCGMAHGITATGELLVEKEDGSVEQVYAGEVSVRGIYGYV